MYKKILHIALIQNVFFMNHMVHTHQGHLRTQFHLCAPDTPAHGVSFHVLGGRDANE